MNPLLRSFLGTILRRVLGYGGVFLVSHGWFESSEMANYITAAAGVLLDLGWSFAEKYLSRAQFVNAVLSPAGRSEDAVKSMPTPSSLGKVGALFLAIGLAASLTACGTRPTRAGQRIAPEAEAALQLERGIDALNALTVPEGYSPVERLVDAKALTRDEAVAVARGIKEAAGVAKNVSLTLEASLAARTEADKQRGMVRAAVLLRSLSDKLATLPITIGTLEGRQKVVDLLRLASGLLLTAGSIFPSPAPEGPPPSLDYALAL